MANHVMIFGNLGAAPDTRQTASGLAVTNLSVATNERVKQQGEWTDHTEWHRVTVFGKQAEVCNQFLAKGSKVLVTGKLRTRKFTDKQGHLRQQHPLHRAPGPRMRFHSKGEAVCGLLTKTAPFDKNRTDMSDLAPCVRTLH